MSFYEVVYSVTNILQIYIIYRFMYIFFERRRSKLRLEVFSFVIYYLINTTIYLLFRNPYIQLSSNLIAIYILTYNYNGSIVRRCWATIGVSVVLGLVEIVGVLLTTSWNNLHDVARVYESIVGVILIKLMMYIVLLIFEKYKSIKKGNQMPRAYWHIILYVPLACFYLVAKILIREEVESLELVVCIILILGIIVAVFYLYDQIVLVTEEEKKRVLQQKQQEYQAKHYETIKENIDNIRAFRHDIKNHFSSLYLLIQQEENKRAIAYIEQLVSGIEEIAATYSGNDDVDRIINYKVIEAEKKGILVDVDIDICDELPVSSFDLTIVLGNLLDNAISATSIIEENREIYVEIDGDGKRLSIMIKNNYKEEIREFEGEIITSNEDEENHGFGLINVRKVVESHNGEMDISYANNIFVVNIVMYGDGKGIE